MKSRFTLQSLILMALAPVLIALAALWALHVYRSAHRIILDGFDRKLLAIAGGSAALIDGDAHADFQRRREIAAITPLPAGGLAGIDLARDEIVTLNPATGGARRLAAVPESGIRSLTTLGTSDARLLGLTLDGTAVVRYDATGATASTLPLSGRLDGMFADGDRLLGWVGTDVFTIDATTGTVTPTEVSFPESFRSISADRASGEWYGLTMDSARVVVTTPAARTVRTLALHVAAKPGAAEAAAASEPAREPPPVVLAVSFVAGKLYAACGGLATIDPQSGEIARGGFPPGYFDIDDPFFRRYRGAFSSIEKQSGLSFLYTQVYIGEKRIYYVLDGTTGEGYSRPGSTDILPETSQEAAEIVQFVGRPWVSPIQDWQSWGLLKSCFTPVRNSTGKVIAIAGADVDIGVIRRKTRWALTAAILIGIGSVVAAGFVSLRVAHSLTRPLQELKESALWLAAGNYSSRITARGSREIGALAARLDLLRARLEQEHERSHAWLAELRTQRERTSLIHVLDDLTPKTGPAADTTGASGTCTVGGTTVWWFGPDGEDAASAACTRARLAVLVRQLLASGKTPAGTLSLLVASAPALEGAACWESAAQTLHYQVRNPVMLRADGNLFRFEGAGHRSLTTTTGLRWSAALPTQGTAAAPARQT